MDENIDSYLLYEYVLCAGDVIIPPNDPLKQIFPQKEVDSLNQVLRNFRAVYHTCVAIHDETYNRIINHSILIDHLNRYITNDHILSRCLSLVVERGSSGVVKYFIDNHLSRFPGSNFVITYAYYQALQRGDEEIFQLINSHYQRTFNCKFDHKDLQRCFDRLNPDDDTSFLNNRLNDLGCKNIPNNIRGECVWKTVENDDANAVEFLLDHSKTKLSEVFNKVARQREKKPRILNLLKKRGFDVDGNLHRLLGEDMQLLYPNGFLE